MACLIAYKMMIYHFNTVAKHREIVLLLLVNSLWGER